MYVCLCHAVSDTLLAELVEQGASSVLELQKHCQAGTDCGACLKDLKKLLRENRYTSLIEATRSRPLKIN